MLRATSVLPDQNGVCHAPGALTLANPSPFHVSFFDSFGAGRITADQHTMGSLARLIGTATKPTKDKLPWLKLARFGDDYTDKGSLRHDANVLEVTGLEADYDAELMAFGDAVEIATKAGLRAIIYTSPSNGRSKPR